MGAIPAAGAPPPARRAAYLAAAIQAGSMLAEEAVWERWLGEVMREPVGMGFARLPRQGVGSVQGRQVATCAALILATAYGSL